MGGLEAIVNGQEFRSLFLVNEIVTTYLGYAEKIGVLLTCLFKKSHADVHWLVRIQVSQTQS